MYTSLHVPALRSVLLLLLIILSLAVAAPAVRAEQPAEVVLPLPYRGQLDDSPYARSNCGPASLAMVLEAYGQPLPIQDIRGQVNQLQGTWGDYDSGTAIENMAVIARRYGVAPLDLRAGQALRRWTLDDVRRHLRAGHPVIPQIWYPALPGRQHAAYRGDHFIVIVGFSGDDFIYHDPIDSDLPGAFRPMTTAHLLKGWEASDHPYAAIAFAGPAGLPHLLPPPTPTPTVTTQPTATATASPTATQPPTATATLAPTRTATPSSTPPTELIASGWADTSGPGPDQFTAASLGPLPGNRGIGDSGLPTIFIGLVSLMAAIGASRLARTWLQPRCEVALSPRPIRPQPTRARPRPPRPAAS